MKMRLVKERIRFVILDAILGPTNTQNRMSLSGWFNEWDNIPNCIDRLVPHTALARCDTVLYAKPPWYRRRHSRKSWSYGPQVTGMAIASQSETLWKFPRSHIGNNVPKVKQGSQANLFVCSA